METKSVSEPSHEASLEQRRSEAKRKISQLIEGRCHDISRKLEDLAYELNMHSTIATEIRDGSLYDKTEKVFAQGYVMALARALKLDQRELLGLLNIVYQTDGSDDDSPTFMSDYEEESARQQQRRGLFRVSVPFVSFLVILLVIVYWKLYLDINPEPVISDIRIEADSLNFSSAADEVVVDDNQTAVLIEEIPPEPVQPAEPDDLLEFSFAEECWLEVRDSQGREIVWQLYGPGEKVALRGEPPFEIVVGNVKGTTVKYRGEEVELPIDSLDNVARITIP